jgi:hypothetical protein
MVRYSFGKVIGINNNAYQVERCKRLNKKAGLSHLADVVKGDFMKMPFKDGFFDCAYSIEATCHATEPIKVYSEIARVMKEGGLYATYEWVTTPKYDETNEKHRKCKWTIENGNGLPELRTMEQINQAAKDAGFEILEAVDLVEATKQDGFDIPWYSTLKGGCSNFRHTNLGRLVTHAVRICSFSGCLSFASLCFQLSQLVLILSFFLRVVRLRSGNHQDRSQRFCRHSLDVAPLRQGLGGRRRKRNLYSHVLGCHAQEILFVVVVVIDEYPTKGNSG